MMLTEGLRGIKTTLSQGQSLEPWRSRSKNFNMSKKSQKEQWLLRMELMLSKALFIDGSFPVPSCQHRSWSFHSTKSYCTVRKLTVHWVSSPSSTPQWEDYLSSEQIYSIASIGTAHREILLHRLIHPRFTLVQPLQWKPYKNKLLTSSKLLPPPRAGVKEIRQKINKGLELLLLPRDPSVNSINIAFSVYSPVLFTLSGWVNAALQLDCYWSARQSAKKHV